MQETGSIPGLGRSPEEGNGNPLQYYCLENPMDGTFEEKMSEIRLVNRAKLLLISELSMTEPEAHRYIEKHAMDRCVAKKQIAEEIIRTYS